MTTITLPRATVEQALEALEYAQQDRECPSTTRQAIAALRAALAQQAEPVQEPVAWRFKPMIGSPWSLSDDGYYISCKRDKGYIVEPLYAAPPQRKPLPNHDQHCVDVPGYGLMAVRLVRAVERAHGIKE